MDFKSRVNDLPERPHHKRATSSVLKSVMPRAHQRNPTYSGPTWSEGNENSGIDLYNSKNMLPSDHSHARGILREDSGNKNQGNTSPRKLTDFRKDSAKDIGRNEKLAQPTSVKSFGEYQKAISPRKKSGKEEDKMMKKSKSSTSLSALLSRPRSSKSPKKENKPLYVNQEHPQSSAAASMAPPPIWAQFATQAADAPVGPIKIPLNDRKSIDEEIARYTPQAYSPSKQRDFKRPTLTGRSDSKPRPKSECLAARATKESFVETLSALRKPDQCKDQVDSRFVSKPALHRYESSKDLVGNDVFDHKPSQGPQDLGNGLERSCPTSSKQSSRVKTAVAAFNGSSKDLSKESQEKVSSPEVDPQAIESAFESLLDARNVPQNTRDKMRSLDTNIKADFVNKDKFGSGSASSTEGLQLQHSKPKTEKRPKTNDGTRQSVSKGSVQATALESPKKSRPRSLTFTFSKGDLSPSKKHKAERPNSHQRTKSGDLTPSDSSKSLTSAGAAQGLAIFSKNNRPAVPEDYLNYFKRVQEPEKVEVSKVHKLRQLLRNETVGWVDTFITQGGMAELIGLLYRIIKVEWRVEHEDALLHETLLCLKALSTTSSALDQISQMQSTLFPTLLGMLFDKEKKGPCEFTTRGIIITLLSTYLTSSTTSDLTGRARTILSYLRDQSPEETKAPEFITSIYHSRPYRIWNKELDNVTKEVFWIFLHHVNIIPYPDIPADASTYIARHFPREHPPVPAAPYIGGVEWDATNYFTAHIDLLNGLIAAMPTKEERNLLRQELKDSGFERVMGVSLRTCKEALYGCVHEALSTWVGAAKEDGWPYQDVRQGPKQVERKMGSPQKSPKKKDPAPILDMPKLDLGGGGGGGEDFTALPRLRLGVEENRDTDDGGWL